MKKILITGANGALGRAVSKIGVNSGYEIVSTSRTPSEEQNIEQLDITDSDKVSDLLLIEQPDYVLHLAATFENDFDVALDINVRGTWELLNSIKNTKKSIRTLLIGSAAEYGRVLPTENPIDESKECQPMSIYGLTKSWQTHLGQFAARQGQDVVIARIFNLYGAGLSSKLLAGSLEKQIKELLNGSREYIETGPLDSIRDYISLNAASKQLISILERGSTGNIYHVGSGVGVTMRDFVATRLKTYNLSFDVVRESKRNRNSAYDVPAIYANIEKTKALSSGEAR